MEKFLAGATVIIGMILVITSAVGGLQSEVYTVTGDWETQGTLTEFLDTDSDIIFAQANEQGEWTSDIQSHENHTPRSATVLADSREGDIQLSINMWKDTNDLNAEPNETITTGVDTGENTFQFEEEDTYDFFEYEISIEETENVDNQRPHVDELEVVLTSEDTDWTDFNNFLALMALVLLLWGMYAIFS